MVATTGAGLKYLWITLAVLVLGGLFYLSWRQGSAVQGNHLYQMPDAASEAGYCLAVVERIREITREQGDPRLEQFIDEQIRFWRPRVKSSAVKARMALARDTQADGVNEGAHLHLAIQDCGNRAVGLYGAHFPSMDQGP